MLAGKEAEQQGLAHTHLPARVLMPFLCCVVLPAPRQLARFPLRATCRYVQAQAAGPLNSMRACAPPCHLSSFPIYPPPSSALQVCGAPSGGPPQQRACGSPRRAIRRRGGGAVAADGGCGGRTLRAARHAGQGGLSWRVLYPGCTCCIQDALVVSRTCKTRWTGWAGMALVVSCTHAGQGGLAVQVCLSGRPRCRMHWTGWAGLALALQRVARLRGP